MQCTHNSMAITYWLRELLRAFFWDIQANTNMLWRHQNMNNINSHFHRKILLIINITCCSLSIVGYFSLKKNKQPQITTAPIISHKQNVDEQIITEQYTLLADVIELSSVKKMMFSSQITKRFKNSALHSAPFCILFTKFIAFRSIV